MDKVDYEEMDDTQKEATGAEAAIDGDAEAQPGGRTIDAYRNANLEVQIVLGSSRMSIAQILKLGRGSVIELNKKIGEPVEVVLNDRVVARGDLVKVAENRIGVNLTEIVQEHVGEG